MQLAGDQDFTWDNAATSYADLSPGEMGFVQGSGGGVLLALIDTDASVDFQVNIRFADPTFVFSGSHVQQDMLIA